MEHYTFFLYRGMCFLFFIVAVDICCFCGFLFFFFFKQKTAYEMRISDWSSDVCSSDLLALVISESSSLADRPFRSIAINISGLSRGGVKPFRGSFAMIIASGGLSQMQRRRAVSRMLCGLPVSR